ncbi:MAG: stage III sporulation AC/AD family protein [Clostridia bacterium]|nr:stage III sporulation AC/AD family protein [Clostridia bacterium]
MDDMIKIVGAAFLTAITSTILKSTKPELSFAVTIKGIIIILLFILDMVRGSMSVLSEIVALTGMKNGVVQILLKIVGIGYLTEFSVGVLQDFNAATLADKVSLAGKITVILMSLPIINGLLTLFKQFLSLL